MSKPTRRGTVSKMVHEMAKTGEVREYIQIMMDKAKVKETLGLC